MGVATPRTRTAVYMDTGISLVLIPADDAIDDTGSTERAFGWFRRVEDVCTRFDEQSEVMQLARRVGEPIPVSPLLFQAVQIALAVARSAAALSIQPSATRSRRAATTGITEPVAR